MVSLKNTTLASFLRVWQTPCESGKIINSSIKLLIKRKIERYINLIYKNKIMGSKINKT